MWLPPSNRTFIMTQLLYWIMPACQRWRQANALTRVQRIWGWLKKKLSITTQHPRFFPLTLRATHTLINWVESDVCVCLQQKLKSASLRTIAFDHLLVPVHLVFRGCLCPSNYGKQRLRSSKANINLNNDTAELTWVSSREMCVWCTNAASANSFSTSVGPDNLAHLPISSPLTNVALICWEMKWMLHLGEEGLNCNQMGE